MLQNKNSLVQFFSPNNFLLMEANWSKALSMLKGVHSTTLLVASRYSDPFNLQSMKKEAFNPFLSLNQSKKNFSLTVLNNLLML